MPTVVRVVAKPFNSAKLMEELATTFGSTLAGLTWAGFDRQDKRVFIPATERRQIGVSTANGTRVEDWADPAELRVQVTQDLTPAQATALDAVLAAHISTARTQEQQREDQDQTDLGAILAGYTAWDTATNAEKLATLKLLVRILLRRERGSAV